MKVEEMGFFDAKSTLKARAPVKSDSLVPSQKSLPSLNIRECLPPARWNRSDQISQQLLLCFFSPYLPPWFGSGVKGRKKNNELRGENTCVAPPIFDFISFSSYPDRSSLWPRHTEERCSIPCCWSQPALNARVSPFRKAAVEMRKEKNKKSLRRRPQGKNASGVWPACL
jgi:hypothetical protein